MDAEKAHATIENVSFFRHVWILDKERVIDIWNILSTMYNLAEELNIRLLLASSTTIEGYSSLEFTIRSPSSNAISQFVKGVSDKVAFSEWIRVYPAQTHIWDAPNYEDLAFYNSPLNFADNVASAWQDGLWTRAYRNEQLQQKLEMESPLYFAHEWVVPKEVPPNWLKLLEEAHGQGGSLGSELRYSSKNKAGYYIVEIYVRLFSSRELEKFVHEVDQRLGFSLWQEIPQTTFAEGIPIDRNTSQTAQAEKLLNALVEEYSRLNASLSESNSDSAG